MNGIVPVQCRIHPIHGMYLGETSLKDDYSLKRLNSYKYATQLRSSIDSMLQARELLLIQETVPRSSSLMGS